MRIFGLTVGRNEASRYLIPMLEHHLDILDDLFFYDDRSTDETPEIAHDLNCSGEIRADFIPSFAEDEGMFRGGAWDAFQNHMAPRPGDWILVIDCDELLVCWHSAHPADVRDSLEKVIHAAGSHVAVNLDIPEVFGFDEDGCPLIRTDRLWGTIHAPRLFAFRPNGQYVQGEVGAPAVPNYVMGGPWYQTDTVAILHYGYADLKDQLLKYERYRFRLGHSSAHVESILADDKQLVRSPWPYRSTMRSTWTPSTLL
jgi:hypothetical protein